MSTVKLTQAVRNDIYQVARSVIGLEPHQSDLSRSDYIGRLPFLVDAFLTEHSTLLSALDAWPPLWQLVPENVRRRHGSTRIPETLPGEGAGRYDLTRLLLTAKLMRSVGS